MASPPHLPAGACAAASPAEPLAGTALPRVEFWLLLEHYGPWAPKPLESPELNGSARDAIARAMDRLPGLRVQLIRRPDRARVRLPRLYLGRSASPESRMLCLELDSLEGLASLDLVAILESGEHPDARRVEAPLFLVCAHGRRDRCCGVLGVPLFRSMLAEDRSSLDIWQSSHVGGHRFAPNVLVLPEGLMYGRVSPEEAATLVASHRTGTLYDLERVRGRMLFEQAVQAAELFVRKRGALSSTSAPTLLDCTEPEAGVHRVRLSFAGEPRSIAVRRVELDLPARPVGCGDAPTSVMGWEELPGSTD